MSDDADRADLRIMGAVQKTLDITRRAPVLESDGHCLFCDESVQVGALFCDLDCRDDYEKEQTALRRAGRA